MFFYAWVIIAHWEFWHGNFLCSIAISICDISMLMILIDYALAMIILFTLTCMLILLYNLFILVLILLLVHYLDHIFSMLSLLLFILIVIFSFSFCVAIDGIPALCLTICCMTTLLLCVCMLLVYVGHLSIPLPPTLWFRSFPSFLLLLLQVWGLVCVCFSDRASG